MQYKKLLEPGRIGQLELGNRMVMAPMGTNFATADGHVTERMKRFYEERARGGVGLIIMGLVAVDAPRGRNMECQASISDDACLPGLSELTDVIHGYGAKAALQLVHTGRLAMVDIAEGIAPVSPSQTKIAMTEMLRDMTREEVDRMATRYAKMPRTTSELTVDEIKRLVERFGDAAERSMKAGFDGVEIHAAHGYLISSFLSPAVNKREDEYGVELQNRARFLMEIIGVVRGRVGVDYPVWCRIDCREFGIKEGITAEDGKKLAIMLEEAGVDAIHVSGYGGVIGGFIDAPVVYPPGHLMSYTEEIKKSVSIPIIAVGRINPEMAEDALRKQTADFIAIGRPLLADPELPNKLVSGRRDDIRPCIYCYRCVNQHLEGEATLCSVNAAVGEEEKFEIESVNQPKKVVVVGGGPAGMEAARMTALRGHEVTLYEKERRLGGSLLYASIANSDNEGLLNWMTRQIERLPIDVKTGTVLETACLEQVEADAVVIATGPKLMTPDIPGADGPHVFSGHDLRRLVGGENAPNNIEWWMKLVISIVRPVLKRMKPFQLRWMVRTWFARGKNIVIVGGDLAAVELAGLLVAGAKGVTILSDRQFPTPDMTLPARWRVMRELRKNKVTILNDVQCKEITDQGITIEVGGGEQQFIEVDMVIIAGEAMPDSRLYESLKDKITKVYQAGDCAEVGMIRGAVSGGGEVGMSV